MSAELSTGTRPMSAHNRDIVRTLFGAVAARDLGPMFEIYDPDIVIREAASLPYGGEYHGHQGMLDHGMGFARTWDPFQGPAERSLDPEFFGTGDHVFVLWRQRARSAGGSRIDLPATSVYRLREGRILTSTMHHHDTAALLSFLREAQDAAAKTRQTAPRPRPAAEASSPRQADPAWRRS